MPFYQLIGIFLINLSPVIVKVPTNNCSKFRLINFLVLTIFKEDGHECAYYIFHRTYFQVVIKIFSPYKWVFPLGPQFFWWFFSLFWPLGALFFSHVEISWLTLFAFFSSVFWFSIKSDLKNWFFGFPIRSHVPKVEHWKIEKSKLTWYPHSKYCW